MSLCENPFSTNPQDIAMRTNGSWCVLLTIAAVIFSASAAGCGGSTTTGPSPAGTTGQPQSAQPGTANPAEISPALVQKVNDLIRSNQEYIALAEKVQTFDDYKQNADELSRIGEQNSSLAEDIMIAEAKLSAAQKAEFNSKYFEGLAKPSIELKRQHFQRIQSLVR